ICLKNCFYCGIRRDSKNVRRYNLSDEEILGAARFAYENDYGSIVLQSGEVDTPAFVERVDSLLRRIRELSDGALRVTLSLGEQAEETFRRWFESGAHRYLLRIEASNPEL
ncbi:MAG TPA: [FeFe] hydrogenase H-cluster radical SAM maturase HydE, partial [Verrucomicrobia bacterium]|nr:[FeFe] hydrogenase H-cluster radical SAM maturase HydE [Verrucomicrobiota bacterium]